MIADTFKMNRESKNHQITRPQLSYFVIYSRFVTSTTSQCICSLSALDADLLAKTSLEEEKKKESNPNGSTLSNK